MFTRDQIEEIKKKLVAFGTKDTQLLDAHKLDGNEIVAIVQDGENRKIPLSSIIGLLSDISVTPNDDFINVSKDTTGFLTLSTAVSKVDINNRKLGQVITFKDSANSWAIRQFTGSSLDNWHDISLWKSISGIDELKSQADTNTNNISSLNTEVSTLQSKVDVNTTSISKNKVAIEKNTSDIKNVSDTVDAQAARLDDVDTTLENALFKNKGYFTTLEKLNEAIPNPTIGSKAYVGTSEPYAIYIVENGVWVDSGYTGGDEIVAKITTNRIENGAVTTEKIATTAFDSTLSVSGKIAPADVVGEKFTYLEGNIYDTVFLDTVLKYDNSDGYSYYVNTNTGVNRPSPIRGNYWAINVYEVMAGMEYQIVIPKTVDSSVCRNVSFALTKGAVSPDALFNTDGTTGTGNRYEAKYIPTQNGFILISFMYSTVDGTVVYGEPTVEYQQSESRIDKLETSFARINNQKIVKVNSVDDISELGKIYSIETELILEADLVIPEKSTLCFNGGSIDGNGYSVDFNGCYLDGSVSLIDVIPSGKVSNLTLNINMFGTKTIANSNYVVNAFALASMSCADIVLDEKTYTITKPVFVYNKVNVVGNGCTFNVSGNHDFAFIFGTNKIKGDSLAWEGSFSHVNIDIIAGRFNQIIGLFNACNSEIAYCNIDCSRTDAECYNKIIGRVNNSNVVVIDGTILNNYHIHHNTTRVHADTGGEDRNNCECIGVEGVTDVNIEFNTIWNTRDDLGVHNCQNVRISHNILNDVYDGRIFCTNSKDVEITYNYIYYKIKGGNGIYIGHEDVYQQIAERYKIIGNYVNFLEIPTTPNVWAGIYIDGARYVDVLGNTLIGNYNQAKITIVEHPKSSGTTFDTYAENSGYLVPCNINIENNNVNSIFYSCGNRVVDNVRVINNNIKRSLFLNNPSILIGGNKIEGFFESLSHNIQGCYADFRPSFIINKTPITTEEGMLLDGHIASFIAPCDLVWTGRFSSYMDLESVTGTYLAYLYVDDVKVTEGTATITSCIENKATNAKPTIIKRGSKISVKIRRNVASATDATFISYIPLMYKN